MQGDAGEANQDAIEIQLRNASQLFNTLDPYPFRERDLDSDAEQYIVSRAQTLPTDRPISIVISVQPEVSASVEADVASAINNWFTARAQGESDALRLLFRDGRLAFLIGIVMLAMCLFFAWYLTQHFAGDPFARLIQESFIIVGWVVIWRPVEMFLYDWVPMLRRRNLFLRLAAAQVRMPQA